MVSSCLFDWPLHLPVLQRARRCSAIEQKIFFLSFFLTCNTASLTTFILFLVLLFQTCDPSFLHFSCCCASHKGLASRVSISSIWFALIALQYTLHLNITHSRPEPLDADRHCLYNNGHGVDSCRLQPARLGVRCIETVMLLFYDRTRRFMLTCS